MMQNGHPSLIESLRKVGSGIIRLYKARLEIILIEAREEIERIERRLILLELLGFLLTMGCICLTGAGVVLLGRALGYAWAFAIFAVVYFVAAVAGFLYMKHERNVRSEPFSQTLREFEKDAEQVCAIIEREKGDGQPRESEAKSRMASFL
jgi:uncharacterized membrane protein YqjE